MSRHRFVVEVRIPTKLPGRQHATDDSKHVADAPRATLAGAFVVVRRQPGPGGAAAGKPDTSEPNLIGIDDAARWSMPGIAASGLIWSRNRNRSVSESRLSRAPVSVARRRRLCLLHVDAGGAGADDVDCVFRCHGNSSFGRSKRKLTDQRVSPATAQAWVAAHSAVRSLTCRMNCGDRSR